MPVVLLTHRGQLWLWLSVGPWSSALQAQGRSLVLSHCTTAGARTAPAGVAPYPPHAPQ